MKPCFLCEKTDRSTPFDTITYQRCVRMWQFRKAKNHKYADLKVPEMPECGYHGDCLKKFLRLSPRDCRAYERMFALRKNVCLFCDWGDESELPMGTCNMKLKDLTRRQAKTMGDRRLLQKMEERRSFDFHRVCRIQYVELYDKFVASRNRHNSMPLQQRLTAIASSEPEKPEKPVVPPLKSQPLSPTKLKVTRQSTSKPQQQPQPKPIEEDPKPVKEEVCLKWNTHHANMQTAFPTLLNKEQYCDVTLVAEGRSLKCHRLILSSCSSYFDEVLAKVVPYQHPIIFMKDIPFDILRALCDFMYVGEVNIVQTDLDQILAVGESLKIKGLASRSESPKPAPVVEKAPVVEELPQKTPAKSSRTRAKAVVSDKKVASNNDAEITDPLDLMEKTYEEAATPDVPPTALKRNDSARKSTGKRVRKRKHVEVDHEPSPPVFRMRKGTRSRPNVKVPRYFNANFDNSAPPAVPEPSEFPSGSGQPEEAYIDSYMNILEQIKTEPLDIEDGLISFEEDSFNHETDAAAMQQDDAPAHVPKKLPKRRKLSRTGKVDPLNVDESAGNVREENSDDVLENSDAVMEMGEQNFVEEEPEHSFQEDEVEIDIEEHGISFTSVENSDRGERSVEISETEGRDLDNGEESIREENSEGREMDVENSEGISQINILEVHAESNDLVNVAPELENSDRGEFNVQTEVADEEIALRLENSIEVVNVESANVSKEIGEVDRVEEESYHEIRIENSYTDKMEELACEADAVDNDDQEIAGLNEENQVTTMLDNAETNEIVENMGERKNAEENLCVDEEKPQEIHNDQSISAPKEDITQEISTIEEKNTDLT